MVYLTERKAAVVWSRCAWKRGLRKICM